MSGIYTSPSLHWCLTVFLQLQMSYRLVQAIADDAQAILGMDYAWLDDVTTHDWKRYHKLDSSKLPCPFLPSADH